MYNPTWNYFSSESRKTICIFGQKSLRNICMTHGTHVCQKLIDRLLGSIWVLTVFWGSLDDFISFHSLERLELDRISATNQTNKRRCPHATVPYRNCFADWKSIRSPLPLSRSTIDLRGDRLFSASQLCADAHKASSQGLKTVPACFGWQIDN